MQMSSKDAPSILSFPEYNSKETNDSVMLIKHLGYI